MTILEQIAPLFDGWKETMVWSCLQGVMGRAEANEDGTAAMIVHQDFTFLAGRPDQVLLAGARLILECLDRGLYPSWDAIDLRSVALAEKLGYHRGESYTVYWLKK